MKVFSRIRLAIYALFIVFIARYFLVGEEAWLGFLTISPLFFMGTKIWRYSFAIPLLTISLHFTGFKLYGVPTMNNNQPLTSPLKVTKVIYPNMMEIENGERISIAPYSFEDYLPSDTWDENDESIQQMVYEHVLLSPMGEAEVEFDAKDQSKLYIKKRTRRHCGTCALAKPFPHTIDKNQRVALTDFLKYSRLAKKQ